VDSEELAARLDAGGWQVSTDADGADVVLVNTCGFVEKAKQDSIETLLAAADTGAKVVAAGCMAERYGKELADSLPEAEAVLGFDDYPDIAARLDGVLNGESFAAHPGAAAGRQGGRAGSRNRGRAHPGPPAHRAAPPAGQRPGRQPQAGQRL
jgi:tRNA A37 methylthiotransferase MiaB